MLHDAVVGVVALLLRGSVLLLLLCWVMCVVAGLRAVLALLPATALLGFVLLTVAVRWLMQVRVAGVLPLMYGACALPLAAVPLAVVPLAVVPLAAVPLAAVPLAAVPLAAVLLAAVLLAAVLLAAVLLAAVLLAAVLLAAVLLAAVLLAAVLLAAVLLAAVLLAAVLLAAVQLLVDLCFGFRFFVATMRAHVVQTSWFLLLLLLL